ncbi:MAG: radical SAM protein [Candidatus Thermoplasmatota archaeon]|nr:radical SAM protein [Candidatus Thermoplasmatota archaeon]MCL5666145.1 radical SAM protein [Candidatus Thermoplasmatota archaeon]
MEAVHSYGLNYWLEQRSYRNLGQKEVLEITETLTLPEIMMMGDALASSDVGDLVTYAVSYNINYSNYCAASCPICAFYVPAKAKGKISGGYELSVEDIHREALKAREAGATEVHVVGGFNPYLDIEYYENIFREIKSVNPQATLKALTIPEYDFIARTTGNSLRETVSRFMEAGVDAHTGGGAEIFDPEVRKQITTPEKISGEKWLEDAKVLHSMGLRGNSTITYGHVEETRHIVDHLTKLRENEIEQSGFLSIIPLKFSLNNTPLQKMKKVKMEASAVRDILVISLARIIAGSVIPNISVYWISLGKSIAQMALRAGGSDLVGTAFSEKVFGATDKHYQADVASLSSLVRQIGKIPAQRDTFYNIKSMI